MTLNPRSLKIIASSFYFCQLKNHLILKDIKARSHLTQIYKYTRISQWFEIILKLFHPGKIYFNFLTVFEIFILYNKSFKTYKKT